MQLQTKSIKKIALGTDLHLGRKSNSRRHNEDCLAFINWFCSNVKKDKTITHIAFLGDWFESRSAINIETLDYSRRCVKLLDDIGLPIYFIVGNHDLHRRTTRDVHSVKIFEELKNFTIIDNPTVIDNVLFCPYLFEHEYKDLIQYKNLAFWAGHFEFKNFAITGYNTLAIHGADHKLFSGPKKIFSGHFHKRQINDNVQFIGNCFPMDWGDAEDLERGMCIYSVDNDQSEYINWNDCPKYTKTTLSKLYKDLENKILSFKNNSYVKCIVDIDIAYTDAQAIRDDMVQTFNLRDFILEENKNSTQDLLEDGSLDELEESTSIDDLVVKQLSTITNNKTSIDVETLIKIYKELPLDLQDNE